MSKFKKLLLILLFILLVEIILIYLGYKHSNKHINTVYFCETIRF
ncbi:MAG: hypothetical protein AB2417_07990 [Clostridiaceae bacterium]